MLMVILGINLCDDTIYYKTIILKYMKLYLNFESPEGLIVRNFIRPANMSDLRVGPRCFYFVYILASISSVLGQYLWNEC